MWYWDDWFSSFDVRDCCLAARGLWIDMLGIMAKSEVKGCLILSGGRQVDSKAMAKFAGCLEEEVKSLWKELEEHRVFDRLLDGTIINRRMFNESKRQKRLANIRSKAGRIGAKIRWQTDADANANGKAKGENEYSSSLKNKNLEGNKKDKERRDYDDRDIRLVQLLIDLMQENDPNSAIIKRLTPKRQDEWINQCRLLREADGRSSEEIEAIIRFSQTDDFWKSNILSMPKLRKQFPQLFLKAKKSDKFAGIREWLEEEKRRDTNDKPRS